MDELELCSECGESCDCTDIAPEPYATELEDLYATFGVR